MDCRTAESLIPRYIKHDLSVRELDRFLDHINSCQSCYEELETYFIVHEATQQLSEKQETDLDFRKLLDGDIAKSKAYLRRMRAEQILRIGFFFLLGLAVMILILFIVNYT